MKRLVVLVTIGLLIISGGTPNFAYSNAFRTNNLIGTTSVKSDKILTYVGKETEFYGQAFSPDAEIARYQWDFNGDGVFDWESPKNGQAVFTYHTAGDYLAIFQAVDRNNQTLPAIFVKVSVAAGQASFLKQQSSLRGEPVLVTPNQSAPAPDNIQNRYAIIMNGSTETRFWEDVQNLHQMLISYGFSESNIFIFNSNGLAPDGTNPGNIIDYPAKKEVIRKVGQQLAGIIDSDDLLYIWAIGHGWGYFGQADSNYGFLASKASVDSNDNDEKDYLESQFKLRSLVTYGDYKCNHGMNIWKVCKRYDTDARAYQYYRNKFVSRFDNVYFEKYREIRSDSDLRIERFIDYPAGDFNRNGIIETNLGEVYDFDGDGIMPYDPKTETFDEGDWGNIDEYEDDYNILNTLLPEGCDSFIMFDDGFDNCLDIDFNSDGTHLTVDGTDLDNQGLFDRLDINGDGDYDDWVSIDERYMVHGGDMTDDELREWLAPIKPKNMIIILSQCFSGGFIKDLSQNNRIVISATQEETVSWNNTFTRNILTAFCQQNYPGGTKADPGLADTNRDGAINFLECFNYAAKYDYEDEIPQYDDNGDGQTVTFPLPVHYEGVLGETIFLLDRKPVPTYLISAYAEPGGTIEPLGLVRVKQGGNQSFAIHPQPGYQIFDLKLNGFSIGATSNHTIFNISCDNDIQVFFEETNKKGAFLEENGIVVMEAEHFTGKTINLQTGHQWINRKLFLDNSGEGLMMALPNIGANMNDTIDGPRMDYLVHFRRTGRYVVWVRMFGLNVDNDSIHVGLNNIPVTYGLEGMNDAGASWHWEERIKGQSESRLATIDVDAPSYHYFNIWMREDGVGVDKIILIQDPDYTPSGFGPTESRRF